MSDKRNLPNATDTADANRFRWLLNGNGYFLEEEGLCGHGPTDDEEKEEARAVIDEAMLNDRLLPCPCCSSHSACILYCDETNAFYVVCNCGMSTTKFSKKKDVVDVWNQRQYTKDTLRNGRGTEYE